MMMRPLLLSAFAATLALGGGAALAGKKTTLPTTVNFSGRTAKGSLGAARNSANTIEQIGCNVNSWTGGIWVECTATANVGTPSLPIWVTASCDSDNEHLVRAAQAIGSDSVVQFWWDASNQCTGLWVGNHSDAPPKAP